MGLEVVRSYNDLINAAKKAEADQEEEKAAAFYEKAIKAEPLSEMPYNRLMILYRKKKNYRDELRIINKGIETFKEFHEKRSQKVFGKDKKAIQLSQSLAKSLGQKDRKGKSKIYPEPIQKWMTRAETVEKKLNRKKKN